MIRRDPPLLGALAAAAAIGLNLFPADGRSVVAVGLGTASIVLFTVLCMVRPARPAARALAIAAAIVVLVGLSPWANRGVPLILTAVLAIRATGAYGVAGGALLVAGALGGWVGAIALAHPSAPVGLGPEHTVLSVALTAIVVFGSLIALTNAVRSEAAARAELQTAHERLRREAERAQELATLRERSRIALELHDAIGHGLTTATIQVQSASRLRATDPHGADAFLALAEASLATLLTEVRAAVGTLRSDPLEGVPLHRALERLAASFAETNAVRLERDVEPLPIEPPLATVIFRVVQGALTNVARHAGASSVRLVLRSDEAGRVALVVEDDGCGFRREDAVAGHGLAIMAERIRSVGGAFDIASMPGAGCRITATIPLPAG